MATPVSHLLRLPLIDSVGGQNPHVLVGITRTKAADKDSDHAPNLELVATDDVHVFVLSLPQSKISKYRQDEGPRSEIEWENDLRALLVEVPPIGDVTAVARTDGSGYMFLDMRNKVCGDTIIGSLKLRRSNKAQEDLELFPWCAEALRARDELQAEVIALRRDKAQHERAVAEYAAHFKDLEQSKRQFEAQHDSWLKDLLNEKKVKIRTQNRIQAAANMGPDQLCPRTTGPSRKGKRKAAYSGVAEDTKDAAEETNGDEDVEAELEGHVEMYDAGLTPTGSETESASDEPEPPHDTSRQDNRASSVSTTGSTWEARAQSEGTDHDRKAAPANRKKPRPVYDDDSTV